MGADDLERIVRGAGHPSTTGAVASTGGASSVVRTLSPQGPARQTQQQPLQIRTCGGSHELAALAAELDAGGTWCWVASSADMAKCAGPEPRDTPASARALFSLRNAAPST